jgi:hypothetical protein
MLETAPAPDFKAYSLALSRRTTWIRQWAIFMRKYQLLLCPVSLAPPMLLGADVGTQAEFEEIARIQAPSFAIPVLGLPGVSVPTGVAHGLPTGVQIVGQRFREDLVLDAAEVIEARCPNADRSALLATARSGTRARARPCFQVRSGNGDPTAQARDAPKPGSSGMSVPRARAPVSAEAR